MTMPTETPQQPCTLLQAAGLGCSKPAGHAPPCAPVQNTEPPTSDPQPGSASAASSASKRKYGFTRPQNIEFDMELSNGDLFLCRKIRNGSELELDLIELMNGFTPELVEAVQKQDAVEMTREVAKPENRQKLFGPIDRIVVSAVVCPAVVLDGPTTDDQINVKDIDPMDRMAIFTAAFGEQLARIKSLLSQPQLGLPNLPDGQGIRAEAE